MPGPRGAVMDNGEVRQIIRAPLDTTLAIALLETASDFHIRPQLGKAGKDEMRALSAFVQFGPYRGVEHNSLDPMIYNVRVQDLWDKMGDGTQSDIWADTAQRWADAFKDCYVVLTHDPDFISQD